MESACFIETPEQLTHHAVQKNKNKFKRWESAKKKNLRTYM